MLNLVFIHVLGFRQIWRKPSVKKCLTLPANQNRLIAHKEFQPSLVRSGRQSNICVAFITSSLRGRNAYVQGENPKALRLVTSEVEPPESVRFQPLTCSGLQSPASEATMTNLIPIKNLTINGEQTQSVDARSLHSFLGIGRDFSNWVTDRIEQYGFTENEDYVVFTEIGENLLGGRPRKEYTLSLDMAKELAMIENNDQGRKVRRYFIQCEKAYRTGKTVPVKAHTRVIKPRGDAKALPAPEKPKDDGNPILEMELFNRIREAELRHRHGDFVHLLTHTVMGMINSFDKLKETRETYGLVQKIVKKEAA